MKDSVEVSARERLVSAVVGEPAAFFFTCLLAYLLSREKGTKLGMVE